MIVATIIIICWAVIALANFLFFSVLERLGKDEMGFYEDPFFAFMFGLLMAPLTFACGFIFICALFIRKTFSRIVRNARNRGFDPAQRIADKIKPRVDQWSD